MYGVTYLCYRAILTGNVKGPGCDNPGELIKISSPGRGEEKDELLPRRKSALHGKCAMSMDYVRHLHSPFFRRRSSGVSYRASNLT